MPTPKKVEITDRYSSSTPVPITWVCGMSETASRIGPNSAEGKKGSGHICNPSATNPSG